MQPSFEPYAAPATEAPEPPGTSIRYGEALRFAFRAEKPWMNILVMTVFALIPVAGPIALGGWHCEIMQRLVRRHPTPIPTLEFSDFTHYLSRGVQPFVVRVLVSLPLSFVIVFASMVGGVAGSFAARSGDPTVLFVVWGLILLAIVFLSPIIAILAYAAYTRADLVEELGPAMTLAKIKEYVRITWLTVLGSTILFGMISFGLVMLGLVACYFGIFIASAVVQLGQLHLRWQIYERFVLRGGEPIVPKPPVALPSEQARANPYAPYGQQPAPGYPPPPPVYPQQPPPQPPFYPPQR